MADIRMLKVKFYRIDLRPAMLYDMECWATKKPHASQMSVAEIRMSKLMGGYTLRDTIRSKPSLNGRCSP